MVIAIENEVVHNQVFLIKDYFYTTIQWIAFILLK